MQESFTPSEPTRLKVSRFAGGTPPGSLRNTGSDVGFDAGR